MIAHSTPNDPIPSTTGTVPPGEQCTPSAPGAPDDTASSEAYQAPSWDVIATILLDHEDETFSAHLVQYVTTDDLGPHTAPLQDARVMTRLCALADALFTTTLLALAAPAHAGLTLLYEEPIMALQPQSPDFLRLVVCQGQCFRWYLLYWSIKTNAYEIFTTWAHRGTMARTVDVHDERPIFVP